MGWQNKRLDPCALRLLLPLSVSFTRVSHWQPSCNLGFAPSQRPSLTDPELWRWPWRLTQGLSSAPDCRWASLTCTTRAVKGTTGSPASLTNFPPHMAEESKPSEQRALHRQPCTRLIDRVCGWSAQAPGRGSVRKECTDAGLKREYGGPIRWPGL